MNDKIYDEESKRDKHKTMNKLLVILGPTATGKTDLALRLAKKFNGELVSCDSRQVYMGLDIGTGKLPGKGKWEVRRGRRFWEIGGIRVWMYDVLKPDKQYTVYDYVKDANRAIGKIGKSGKLPIVVGGTGFYLKALLEGLPNLLIPVDQVLRKKLEKLSSKELKEKLQTLSIKRWEKMNQSDRGNPRRLIRAIELGASGRINQRIEGVFGLGRKFDILKIGLSAPRKILYERANERVIDRINQGMIEEANKLHEKGLSLKRMRQLGLEYGVLVDYLSGKISTEDELTRILQNKIHGYIRRQLTWFKKEKDVLWFDITDEKYLENVEKKVSKWYHQVDDTKNRHLP